MINNFSSETSQNEFILKKKYKEDAQRSQSQMLRKPPIKATLLSQKRNSPIMVASHACQMTIEPNLSMRDE